MSAKLHILAILLASPCLTYFINLNKSTPRVCLMFILDEAMKVEEVTLIAMNEFTSQSLRVEAINMESNEMVDLMPMTFHLERKYDIHPSMYPKLSLCLYKESENGNDLKVKVVTKSNDIYTSRM